jgi:alpha-glucuronidase
MVYIPPTIDNDIKVFNTAKKYAEEILFPKMSDYQMYQRMFNFGGDGVTDSVEYTPEIRDINRFNGLKGMADIEHDLLMNISSTVRLKNNNTELKKLQELTEKIEKIQNMFDNKDRFFISGYSGGDIYDKLNLDYCRKIREIINVCYINTEMLMTQNGLLFRNVKDEFMEDSEIMKQIKEEYVNN